MILSLAVFNCMQLEILYIIKSVKSKIAAEVVIDYRLNKSFGLK